MYVSFLSQRGKNGIKNILNILIFSLFFSFFFSSSLKKRFYLLILAVLCPCCCVQALCLVVACGGYPQLWCTGFLLWWLLLFLKAIVALRLYSMGSVIMALGLTAPWHVEPSQIRDRIHVPALASRFLPLDHHGSPYSYFLLKRGNKSLHSFPK